MREKVHLYGFESRPNPGSGDRDREIKKSEAGKTPRSRKGGGGIKKKKGEKSNGEERKGKTN